MIKNKALNDIIICIGTLIFLGGFATQMTSVPKNARGYPFFLLLISMFLTFILLIKSARAYIAKKTEAEEPKHTADMKSLIHTILYGVITGLYIFFITKTGYIIATILFVFISLWFLNVRNKKLLILLPPILSFSMYFLFTSFLMVTLPRGTWLMLIF